MAHARRYLQIPVISYTHSSAEAREHEDII